MRWSHSWKYACNAIFLNQQKYARIFNILPTVVAVIIWMNNICEKKKKKILDFFCKESSSSECSADNYRPLQPTKYQLYLQQNFDA